MIPRLQKPEMQVALLSFFDGIQAVVLITLLPFLLFVNTFSNSSSLSLASPLGIGYLLSVAGTFAVGYGVDRWDPIRVLLLSQGFQFFILLILLGSALQGRSVQTAFTATLALVFSRSLGPAKDKIRTLVIRPERRRHVNSEIRRYFLVVTHLFGLFSTVCLSVLPVSKWPLMLIVALSAVAGSVVVTLFLRPICNSRNFSFTGNRETPSPTRIRPVLFMLVIPIGLSLTAGLPSVGFSAWLAATRTYQPWMVGVVGTILVALDFLFLKAITQLIETGRLNMSRLHRIGGVLVSSSCCLTYAALQFPPGLIQLLVLSAGFVCVAFCVSISSLISMEIQYGFGEERTRGRIASLTRVSVTIGYGVTSWLSPAIFFQNLIVFFALFFAGALLTLIPRRYCLYSDDVSKFAGSD